MDGDGHFEAKRATRWLEICRFREALVRSATWRFADGDVNTAEDLVSDAMVRAIEKIDHLNGRKVTFSWLYAIVKNLAADRGRLQAKDRAIRGSLGSSLQNGDGSLERSFAAQKLNILRILSSSRTGDYMDVLLRDPDAEVCVNVPPRRAKQRLREQGEKHCQSLDRVVSLRWYVGSVLKGLKSRSAKSYHMVMNLLWQAESRWEDEGFVAACWLAVTELLRTLLRNHAKSDEDARAWATAILSYCMDFHWVVREKHLRDTSWISVAAHVQTQRLSAAQQRVVDNLLEAKLRLVRHSKS